MVQSYVLHVVGGIGVIVGSVIITTYLGPFLAGGWGAVVMSVPVICRCVLCAVLCIGLRYIDRSWTSTDRVYAQRTGGRQKNTALESA